MPSPDLTPYHSLTLFDRSPSELVDRAVLDSAVKMPGWLPRTGHPAMVLIESLALLVAELIFGVNRVPDADVEVILRLLGVDRSLGTPPTATVTVQLSTLTGYTMPAGTTMRLTIGTETVDFTTDAAAEALPGSDTLDDVPVTATSNTSAVNGTAAGAAVQVIDAIPYIDNAVLASAVAAGSDAEDDATWITRGVQRLGRLVTTLVLPDHFTAYALENPTVYRATTIDNYDGVGASMGADAGHVTVAVLGPGGAFLSAPAKAALAAEMDALAQVNLAVHVIDPTITNVAVVAEGHAAAGYDAATVETNVLAALDAFLSPDTWAWGTVLRRNDLIALLEGVEGVDYLTAGHPTTPNADVALGGAAPLLDFDAGGSTITVL